MAYIEYNELVASNILNITHEEQKQNFEVVEEGGENVKLEKIVIANASALSMAIVYVLCRILVALFPGVSFSIAQSWFHNIQVVQVNEAGLAVSSFVMGLISVAITSWIVGYIFGWSWEKMSKR